MIKINWKAIPHAIALGLVLFGVFLFVLIFLTAYISPDKEVVVNINSKGEANLELFGLVIPMIFATFFVLHNYKKGLQFIS